MGLRIEYYRFFEIVTFVSISTSLAAAEKEAVAGLERFEADRAKILDDTGKTLMVISAYRQGWEAPEQ